MIIECFIFGYWKSKNKSKGNLYFVFRSDCSHVRTLDWDKLIRLLFWRNWHAFYRNWDAFYFNLHAFYFNLHVFYLNIHLFEQSFLSFLFLVRPQQLLSGLFLISIDFTHFTNYFKLGYLLASKYPYPILSL